MNHTAFFLLCILFLCVLSATLSKQWKNVNIALQFFVHSLSFLWLGRAGTEIGMSILRFLLCIITWKNFQWTHKAKKKKFPRFSSTIWILLPQFRSPNQTVCANAISAAFFIFMHEWVLISFIFDVTDVVCASSLRPVSDISVNYSQIKLFVPHYAIKVIFFKSSCELEINIGKFLKELVQRGRFFLRVIL